MANNYYTATGVLVLDKVTPVIRALFGGYRMDESYPGNGEVYIARIAEENDPSWDAIYENLQELAAELSLAVPESDDDTDETPVGALLKVLSAHFHTTDNVALRQLIEGDDFDEDVSLEVLLTIATCFEDGHDLKAIKWEGSWNCSRPRLFEFGGHGQYLSKCISANSDSSHALELGENLHTAILYGNLDQAAVHLKNEVLGLLGDIRDDSLRGPIRRRLAKLLLQEGHEPT